MDGQTLGIIAAFVVVAVVALMIHNHFNFKALLGKLQPDAPPPPPPPQPQAVTGEHLVAMTQAHSDAVQSVAAALTSQAEAHAEAVAAVAAPTPAPATTTYDPDAYGDDFNARFTAWVAAGRPARDARNRPLDTRGAVTTDDNFSPLPPGTESPRHAEGDLMGNGLKVYFEGGHQPPFDDLKSMSFTYQCAEAGVYRLTAGWGAEIGETVETITQNGKVTELKGAGDVSLELGSFTFDVLPQKLASKVQQRGGATTANFTLRKR